MRVDAAYRQAMGFALASQLVLGLLSGLILDGGQLAQFWMVGMAGFWGGTLVLILRHPHPSRTDLAWIHGGIFPVLLACPLVMGLVWQWRGI